MTDSHATRRNHAAIIARAQGLGALAFVPGANFTYLTGLQFHLMERPTLLFVTASAEVLAIMPELEREKWAQTFPDALTCYWQDADGYAQAFLGAAAALAASPYAGLIVHKTGHGLGMDIHEAPQIMRGNHRLLASGTVFTIEPGLYRPGDIGVRIEDNVVISAAGATVLTGFPRELTLVGG